MSPSKATKQRRWAIIAVILVAIGVYIFFQVRALASGPRITITNPEHDAVVTESLVTISGTAKNATELSLNGAPLFMDETGAFAEERVLLPGINIFELTGTDRFNKLDTKTFQVVYTPV